MKIIRRYLFTVIFHVLSLTALAGWWHSSKVWMAWIAETPFGIFKIQSESSIFGMAGQFMTHEHRWAAYSNSDAITGDHMEWIVQVPKVQFGSGFFLILPYWQLILLLLAFAGLSFFLEKKRIAKARAGLMTG